MGTKYRVTSDLHYWHKNILNFESSKRFRGDLYKTVEQMNQDLTVKFNHGADANTVTFVLGDFCFGHGKQVIKRLEEILDELVGHIVLVKGNHDNFDAIKTFKKRGHDVCDYYEFNDYEQKICMSHYPFAAWNKSHYGSVFLHGHCHGSYSAKGRILDVGWDVHGRILGLPEAYQMCMEKDVFTADGH